MTFSESISTSSDGVKLKRNIGLTTACSLIIGSIIGSGIFVSPQGVLIGAGSYGLSLVIWSLCGLLSLCGALTYAEIGTCIPSSGGAYYPIKTIYGDGAAFSYMILNTFFIQPASIAVTTLTCAEYITVLVYTDGCGAAPLTIKQMIATTLTLLITAINAKSVSLSGKISVVFTAAKILALAVITIGGIVYIAKGITPYLKVDVSFIGTSTNVGSIAEAFLSGMWAYDGWEYLNFITEELKKPERNLPLSMFISLPVVTSVYVLVNMAYFAVLSPNELISSTAVATTWANVVIPKLSWFVPVAVVASTFGASSGILLFASRLPVVTARESHLPKIFSLVHIGNFTPTPAVFLLGLLSSLYVYMGTINELINYIGVANWFFHGMMGLGLLLLRCKEREVDGSYKAPIFCPIILMLLCPLLSFGPIIGNPQWGYFLPIVMAALGVILWAFFVKCGLHVPGTDKVTECVQLFLQVIPPEKSKPVHQAEYEVIVSADSKIATYGSIDNKDEPPTSSLLT